VRWCGVRRVLGPAALAVLPQRQSVRFQNVAGGMQLEKVARPSRSLCSASRRIAGAADSIHHLVCLSERCRPVGGTPTGAVATTALPVTQWSGGFGLLAIGA